MVSESDILKAITKSIEEKCANPNIQSLPGDFRSNDLSIMQERLDELDNRIESVSADIKDYQKQINNLVKEIEDLNKEQDSLDSKLDTIKLSENLSDDNFDEELEEYLKNENIIKNNDIMVYESPNIASIPFKNDGEIKEFIDNHAMLVEDDKYYYVLCQDKELVKILNHGFESEDYTVQRLLKRKYPFLASNSGKTSIDTSELTHKLNEIEKLSTDSQKLLEDYLEDRDKTLSKIDSLTS